jgi:phosphoribosylformylglycinamidine cyclo-ligase
MGIGMIMVVSPGEVQAVQADLAARGEKSYIIGKVTAGAQEVILKGGVFGE